MTLTVGAPRLSAKAPTVLNGLGLVSRPRRAIRDADNPVPNYPAPVV